MLYAVPYPYGLDYYVEQANERLYGFLKTRWGVTDTNYSSFGRALRNRVKDGYIPEYFNSSTHSYVGGKGVNVGGGLFFDDSLAAVSFWGLTDPIKKSTNCDAVAKMQLTFFVNLDKLTPGAITDANGQRLDDVCVNDVLNFVQNNGCGFIPTDVYKDIDKVLERYSGEIKKNVLNKNMGKFFCFRIDVELHYNPQIFRTPQPLKQLEPMDKTIVLFIKTTPDAGKVINVGNGLQIYQEYAPGDTLIPTVKTTGAAYLAGKTVQMLYFCNQPDLLADYSATTGVWTKTGDPGTYGFNDSDFVGITFTDLI